MTTLNMTEAAKIFGITSSALKYRIKRGTTPLKPMNKIKKGNKRVYAWKFDEAEVRLLAGQNIGEVPKQPSKAKLDPVEKHLAARLNSITRVKSGRESVHNLLLTINAKLDSIMEKIG